MNDEKRSRKIFNLSLALVIVLAFLFGFQSSGLLRLLAKQDKIPDWVAKAASGLSYDVHASAQGFSESELGVLYEVLTRISQGYLYREEMDIEEVVHGAATGAVMALGDRYSRFVPPPDQQILTEEIEGEYAGIGIRIFDQSGVLPHMPLECEIDGGADPEDPAIYTETRGVVVVQVFEAGPAYTAGLEQDDAIACVDGNSLRGKTSVDAANLIKGPEGTMVSITIWRPGIQEELTFEVERQNIHVPTIGVQEMLDGRIGYIRLDEFNNQSSSDVIEAVNDLLFEGMEGLIFDLRNNTGGVMSAAIEISDLFISDGDLVSYEDSLGRREVFRSRDGGDAIGIPLIVLVNGNSASASEIVAGAVKDTHVGILVGETTFGKGVVQNVFTLQDGSGLVLTTGRYLTPNENEITQDGLEPDIHADLDPDRLREEDPEIDDFLNRMDELNQQYMELRQQMYDYLQDHDFQRETATEIMTDWLDTGKVPEEWMTLASDADTDDSSETDNDVESTE